MIDLKVVLGGGGGRPLGSEAWFPESGKIIEIEQRKYLRSGYKLVGESANYPELFAAFAVNGEVAAPSEQTLSNGEVVKYMRIK